MSHAGLVVSTAEIVELATISTQRVAELQPLTTIDHRLGRRRNLLVPAELQCRDNHAVGVISNLGWNGMFVMTEVTVPVNCCVDVQLVLPDVGPVIVFPGLVVHNNPNGFGMIFRTLDDVAQNQVELWMNE